MAVLYDTPEVLTAVLIKIQLFQEVMLCQLDVSKEHCALTYSVKQSSMTFLVLLDLNDGSTMLLQDFTS